MFARAHAPSNPGLARNGPFGTRSGGVRAGWMPSRPVGVTLGPLDQWSRPSAYAPGVRPESHTDVVTLSEIRW